MSGISTQVLREHAKKAEAALTNEEITRKRVEGLEQWAIAVSLVLAGGFWARFRWLLFGARKIRGNSDTTEVG